MPPTAKIFGRGDPKPPSHRPLAANQELAVKIQTDQVAVWFPHARKYWAGREFWPVGGPLAAVRSPLHKYIPLRQAF